MIVLQGSVYFYYGLINYYQNHRRYVKSRDDNQLLGKTDAVSSDCQPYQKSSNGSGADYAPCGAIANSKFNGLFHSMISSAEIFVLSNRYIDTTLQWSTSSSDQSRHCLDDGQSSEISKSFERVKL